MSHSPTDPVVVCGDRGGRVSVFSVATGEEMQRYQAAHMTCSPVAISADDRYVLTAGHTPEVKVWVLPTGRNLARLELEVAEAAMQALQELIEMPAADHVDDGVPLPLMALRSWVFEDAQVRSWWWDRQ